MLLQAITIQDQLYEQALGSVDFIQRFIFPGSFIPSVTAITDSVRRATDMKIFHLEDIGPHYATTLRAWRERFFARLDDVRRLGYPEAVHPDVALLPLLLRGRVPGTAAGRRPHAADQAPLPPAGGLAGFTYYRREPHPARIGGTPILRSADHERSRRFRSPEHVEAGRRTERRRAADAGPRHDPARPQARRGADPRRVGRRSPLRRGERRARRREGRRNGCRGHAERHSPGRRGGRTVVPRWRPRVMHRWSR